MSSWGRAGLFIDALEAERHRNGGQPAYRRVIHLTQSGEMLAFSLDRGLAENGLWTVPLLSEMTRLFNQSERRQRFESRFYPFLWVSQRTYDEAYVRANATRHPCRRDRSRLVRDLLCALNGGVARDPIRSVIPTTDQSASGRGRAFAANRLGGDTLGADGWLAAATEDSSGYLPQLQVSNVCLVGAGTDQHL